MSVPCERRSETLRFRGPLRAQRIQNDARDVFLCKKPLIGWENVARLAPGLLSLHSSIALKAPDKVSLLLNPNDYRSDMDL